MDHLFPGLPLGIMCLFLLFFLAMEIRMNHKRRVGDIECMRKMQEDHARELAKERSAAWQEGVRMGAEARRQMRYGQQFHHSKQGKF